MFHDGRPERRKDGRPERRTNMTKLKVALRNYANASKNKPSHLQTGGFPPGKRRPGVDHIREMSRHQRISKQIFSVWYRILSSCLSVASRYQDTAL